MKNFGAMAMNDEELDNVVGGAKVDQPNDVSRKSAFGTVTGEKNFIFDNKVLAALNSLGYSEDYFKSLSFEAQTDLLTKTNLIKYALDNVTGKGTILAHSLENKL